MKQDPQLEDHLIDHLPKLRRIVSKISRDENAVDDITQDCCVQIINSEENWDKNTSKVKQWMNAITRHTTIDNLIRRKRQKNNLKTMPSEEPEAIQKRAEFDEGDWNWAFDQVATLPENQKRLIYMRYFEGKKLVEIASELGVSHAAVSQQLKKAVNKLQARARTQGLMTAILPLGVAKWFFNSTTNLVAGVTAGLVTTGFVAASMLPPDETVSASLVNSNTNSAPKIVSALAPVQAPEIRSVSLKDVAPAKKPRKTMITAPLLQSNVKINIPKAIDLKVKKWPNRELAVKRLQAVFEKKLAVPEEDMTAEIKALKKLIDSSFAADVSNYVESFIPKVLNVTDRKNFYLIYFMLPSADTDIDIINELQLKYANKGLKVCGYMKPLTYRIVPKGWKPRTASDVPPDDPTYYQRSADAVVESMTKMADKMPQFLVAADDVRVKPGVNIPYRTYLRVLDGMKFPEVVLINKKGEVAWLGSPKDTSFYLDKVLAGSYDYRHYKREYTASQKISYYEKSLASFSGHHLGQNMGKEIFTEMKNSPDNLIAYSKRILKRSVLQGRDVKLALKCCLLAQQLLAGRAGDDLHNALAEAYFESGKVNEALGIAKKIRKPSAFVESLQVYKNNTKKVEVAKTIKVAEYEFSMKFWPDLRGSKLELKKGEMDFSKARIARGIRADRRNFSQLIFELLRQIKIKNVAPEKMTFLRELLEAAKAVMAKEPVKEDDVIYGAYGLWHYQMGEYEKCIEFTKKAMQLNKKSTKSKIYKGTITWAQRKMKTK